jgi:hypothetical protein
MSTGKLVQQSVVRLFQYLEISDEDREQHRIYDTEIIELGQCTLSLSLWPFLQCCGSGMFIPDPGSNNSTKRGAGKFFLGEQVKKIFLTKTLGIIVLFTQKFVIKLSKIWFWDPGSGKNLFRIRIRNTAFLLCTTIL